MSKKPELKIKSGLTLILSNGIDWIKSEFKNKTNGSYTGKTDNYKLKFYKPLDDSDFVTVWVLSLTDKLLEWDLVYFQ